jgi:cAMP phosphodiesterase
VQNLIGWPTIENAFHDVDSDDTIQSKKKSKPKLPKVFDRFVVEASFEFITFEPVFYDTMKMLVKQFMFFSFLTTALIVVQFTFGQTGSSASFKCVVLGSGGGIKENNLSAYLLAAHHSGDFICLDAGTVYTGIEEAVKMGNFNDLILPPEEKTTKAGYIFREQIRGYLISHAHLDHIAGLVISSPAIKQANIYGSSQTIESLKSNIFDWETWPNFANEGPGLKLNVLNYHTLIPGQELPVEGTDFKVTAFRVSHQEPYESSAFLIENKGDFVLYIGDTGADTIENEGRLGVIWNAIAPVIRQGKMKGIFMECSYPDEQPEDQLYGHLTPRLFFEELSRLSSIVDPDNQKKALKDIPLIVTGIKPTWKQGGDQRYLIYKQLLLKNTLGVKILIPEQGQLIEF